MNFRMLFIVATLHPTGFRLLTEYHSFLFCIVVFFYNFYSFWFPSPYGVSFILIKLIITEDIICYGIWFPSPYGVSFILILLRLCICLIILCFRLLTEYHSFLLLVCANTYRLISYVSVSLRSIIHSYPTVKKVFYCNMFLECYRAIFLFLKFFCLFQKKASLTPHFLHIV